MALITGTPLGNVISSEELYVEGKNSCPSLK